MAENLNGHLRQTDREKLEEAMELLDCSDGESVTRELLRANGYKVSDDNALKQYADPIHTQRILDAMDLLLEIPEKK